MIDPTTGMPVQEGEDKPYISGGNYFETSGIVPSLYVPFSYNRMMWPNNQLTQAMQTGYFNSIIPNPLSGYRIQLPDGSPANAALTWTQVGEQNSGLYRNAANDYIYEVAGSPVTEWMTTEFRVNYLTPGQVVFPTTSGKLTGSANLFWDIANNRLGVDTASPSVALDVNGNIRDRNMTLGSVLFAAATGVISQDNANFFWDAPNARLGIGCTDPFRSLEVRHSSLPQLVLSTDANNAVMFKGSLTGLNVTAYSGTFPAPDYVFQGDANNDHPSLRIVNNHTTGATSHAWLIAEVGGASAGDPVMLWDVDFATVWGAGIDNSDSDKWKLCVGATLGTNDTIVADTSRNIYFPAYTLGSIPFFGASGQVLQNNASFFWDNALLILKSGVGAAHQWQGTSLPVSAYVSVASTVFSGTQDGILNFGWNINQTRQVGTEPSWYMALESNYNNGADTFCEWYIDFQTTGSVDYRPIGCVISRTTNVASVNVNASSFTWSNEASSTIYGSFTSASGVVFQNIAGTTAKCSIGTNNNVGFISLQDGSTAHIQFYNNGTNIIAGVSNVAMDFRTNNTLKWQIAAAGSLLAGTDNSWDIGASGATRPRSIYWGTQALASDGSVGSPAYSFAGATATGFYKTAASVIRYSANNSASVELGAGYLWVVSDTGIYYLGAGADTAMVRNAAGKVQIGSGTVGVNVGTNGTNCFAAPSAGQIAFATAAKGTTDTTGYFTIPSCAGAPTGVPANIPTGQIPMVYDSTNNFLYVYNGGWKKSTVYA